MRRFDYSEPIINLSSTLVRHISRAAPTQGGVLSGEDPTEFSTADPLRLWVIQVTLVVVTTQILSLLLRKMRQPRVISEVISGVILGPSVMGRVPGFTQTIFPKESLPYLTLTANIGLVLFLFLVGLEIDTNVIKRNAKKSLCVAAAGMCLPFALGTGVAALVYDKFVDKESVSFGNFLLFVGVAFAITAFPVLCRILTELNLLETTVGIIVLSAGVGNDILAWVLLALAVSLVNASSGLTALWVLLATTGFAIFILFPIKYAFARLARSTGALEDGQPSAFMMTITILLVFTSAFMTDILGVHPIFGGFLAGLVIPHESGFAIALTEKLEDLVSLLFLPLYFTLSGLKTDLGLLNNGITWGYTILICAVAFIGKFGGAAGASKLLGFSWREAGAIGVLMSCKGLVELIVLNIGLQSGILQPRVFAMFVIEALVLTFMTTPLTLLIYPPDRRSFHSGVKPEIKKALDDGESQKGRTTTAAIPISDLNQDIVSKTRIAVVLQKLEHLSPLMTMTKLLEPTTTAGSKAIRAAFSALRLMDLSDRTSAVMYGSVAVEELLKRDPLVVAFKTFARLHQVSITATTLSVVPQEEFAAKISEKANEEADLILIPWNTQLNPVIEAGVAATSKLPRQDSFSGGYNPFEAVFGRGGNMAGYSTEKASVVYAQFVRKVFSLSLVDVALFVEGDMAEARPEEGDEIHNTALREGHHLYLPWFGGPDDRLALNIVIQLCSNPAVHATVVRWSKTEPEDPEGVPTAEENEAINGATVHSISAFPDTIYGPETTQHRLASETADNIIWNSVYSPSDAQRILIGAEALGRIEFKEMSSPTPLKASIDQARELAQKQFDFELKRNVIVVVGRGRRLSPESHHDELKGIIQENSQVGGDIRRTLGDVGAGFIVAGERSLLVLQAAQISTDVD